MPELCDKLRQATGIAHTVDADLRDYPVFVSVKSGDPDRVKQLVAAALRAVWQKDGDRYRLSPAKVDQNAGLAEFEAAYKKAAGDNKVKLALPIAELYQMAPGQVLRYGYPAIGQYRTLPKAILDSIKNTPDPHCYVMVRRMSKGIFEFKIDLAGSQARVFGEGGQSDFRSIPKDVENLLKDDLPKQALTADQQQALQKFMSNPATMKIDWGDLSKKDPVAALCDEILIPFGNAVKPDVVVALPDFSVFLLTVASTEGGTVRSLLAPFSNVVDLSVADGALVGELPLPTQVAWAQARRDVLAKFVLGTRAKGVANVDVLSEYVRDQRRAASDSWADVMLLVLAGTVVDEAYVGDYPFNMRLYTQFDRNDWSLLRSGQPFLASQLSLGAKNALRDLLLSARSRLGEESSEPGMWKSLEGDNLSIQAEVKDEGVLIGWTSFIAEVATVSNSAGMYDMRRKSLGKEPLYQPASRRTLKLTIGSIADTQSVDTGFSEVTPDAGIKPSQWDQLPSEIAKQFKAELEVFRKVNNGQQGGGPPPPRR